MTPPETCARSIPAAESKAPRLLIGSHLDTVPNAGAYDGILGVVLAVTLLEALDGRRLPFGIEVVGFSEEEGVRFGTPFIGSRALIGRLDEELLSLQDAQGISVRQAIEDFGLNPERDSSGCFERRYSGLRGVSHRAGPGSGETGAAAGRCRSHRRPEPAGIHIRRPRQPRRHNSDASSPRCDRRRSGVDHRGGAAGATKFPVWWQPWARSMRSPARPTSLPARLG